MIDVKCCLTMRCRAPPYDVTILAEKATRGRVHTPKAAQNRTALIKSTINHFSPNR